MAKIEKLIEKMKRRPNGIRFDEAKKVLRRYGYEHVRNNGSHHIFVNDEGRVVNIVYHGDPIKAVYVEQILEAIGEGE